MTKYTITPWRTQADLFQVRQQLYSQHHAGPDSRRYAVERVMAWKLRGNLPHAVESTALLIDAILHHDIDTNSIFSIRAVYSAAFCRFVTGFCDIGRHKERTLEPSSMLEIAKQIDMPAEFVALRHEATHEDLPAIQRLVAATRQALDWLWKVYWSRLEESEDTVSVPAVIRAVKAEAATILRNFRRSRRDALRNQTHTSPQQLSETIETCDSLVDLCKGIRVRTEALADVLIGERVILPANRDFGSSMEGAFLIWDGLLQNLSMRLRSFPSLFIKSLLGSVAKPVIMEARTDTEKEALAMWVLHVIDSDTSTRNQPNAVVVDVIKWCCLHPGYWTQRIGEEVLERGDDSFRADWQDLFKASAMDVEMDGARPGMLNEDSVLSDYGIRKQSMEGEEMPFERDEGEHAGRWKRAVISLVAPLGVVK